MLGIHLTLDLYECSEKKISSLEFVSSFLERLADTIKVRKLSRPHVFLIPPNPETFDKGGISGYILIAESHITIHTFVKQRFASVDIFSCKEFDVKKAEEFVIRELEPKKYEKKHLERGKEFIK